MPNNIPAIVTTDLNSYFSALRNTDPARIERANLERNERASVTPPRSYSPISPVPKQNLAPVTSVSGAFGGMHRYAGAATGGGMIYGQPQFFSPVHTPINWQIPSKRIETYQWMYLPNTQVLTEDFTYSSLENTPFTCSAIIEDSLVNGFIFEASEYPKIMNSEGIFSQPPRISMRNCENKRCFSFEPFGNYRSIRISEEHYIYVLNGSLHRQNKKNLSGRKYRTQKGIISNGVEKIKIQDRLIKRVRAQDVRKDDYLLTPVPQTGTISINKDLAWLIGFCVADGCIYTNANSGTYSVGFTSSKGEKSLSRCQEILEANFDSTISSKKHGDGKGWRVNISTKKAYNFFREYIVNKGINKKFTKAVFNLDIETRLNILAGYFDGDGSFSTHKTLIANCYSKDLVDQLYWLLVSCEIPASISQHALCKNHYPTLSECYYSICIPNSKITAISSHMNGDKVPFDFIPKKERELRFFYTEDGVKYLAQPINKIEEFLYTGKGFDIEMPNDRKALVADGYVCSNCRFFYQNEAKVAASIDFYSLFPINDYENICKDRKVKKYFDKFKKKLDIIRWCKLISHELHLLGDCFPFLEISCEHCGGSGRLNGEVCEHEGGTVRRIVILNPDYVEVSTTPINPEPLIALKPDEELINMVQRKTPGYERLAPDVRALVAAGKPIRLDNRNVSHLKYGENGYSTYGIGMVRRLFPILSYKTKLMVAQWIVAERLIVPIKVVKVGNDERPAGAADIAAIQTQLAQTANDPNLTLVTHHAFEIDFVGASGKVLTLSTEFELINQEILDGMMINNALLNGEGPAFCHSDDTRILTNNGLKYRVELDIEKDLIATFNKESGALEYQKAIKKYEFDYNSVDGDDKPLRRFLTNRIDMLVTPNHKMLCAPRKLTTGIRGQKLDGQTEGFADWSVIDAAKVKNRSKFRACVDRWDGVTEEHDTYFGIPKNDFLQIVGWYIAEGSRHKDKQRNNKIYSVDIAQSPIANPDVYAKMQKVLTANNICRIYPSAKNSFAITNTANRDLVSYLVNNCGQASNEKCVPYDIKNMSVESLKILLEALVEGDGNERAATRKNITNKKYYSYYTVSTQLRDDVVEILFKLGYSPRFYTQHYDNPKLQTRYIISWSDATSVGRFPVLTSRKWNGQNTTQTVKQVIFDEDYVGKVWCVEVPNHFIITERNGLFGIHGNSNAAVGIEALIERLESFRKQLTTWIEEFIYKPEAIRNGFVEENEDGEQEYIYPTVKWNPMKLRDLQNDKQSAIQLYDKGILSAQTLLELFGYNPDLEIDRKRNDAIQLMALGQGQQGGAPGEMGGGFSGMGGGGGGGGGAMPMPDLGGGAAGGMGGGAGGMGGGEAPISPGAPTGGEAAPTASSSQRTLTAIADPSNYGGRVLTKKTRQKIDQEKTKIYDESAKNSQPIGPGYQIRDKQGRIIFTKPERMLMKGLSDYKENGLIKYPISPQFGVKYGSTEYPLDFAIPHLKIGLEADGETFHSSDTQIEHDKERDMKLNQLGWTILRFTEHEIEKRLPQVMSTVVKTIMQKEMALNATKEQLEKK